MGIDYRTQPNAKSTLQKAKHVLRVSQTGQLEGVDVPFVSALTGAPMVHFTGDIPIGTVSMQVGALALEGTFRALNADDTEASGPRYIMRLGAPDGGSFAVLDLTGATWEGQDIDVAAILTAGDSELMGYERRAVDHMNDDHLDAVMGYAEVLGAGAGEWRLASLDMEGLDLVRCDAGGTAFERLWFHPPLAAPSDIKATLVQLAMAARQ